MVNGKNMTILMYVFFALIIIGAIYVFEKTEQYSFFSKNQINNEASVATDGKTTVISGGTSTATVDGKKITVNGGKTITTGGKTTTKTEGKTTTTTNVGGTTTITAPDGKITTTTGGTTVTVVTGGVTKDDGKTTTISGGTTITTTTGSATTVTPPTTIGGTVTPSIPVMLEHLTTYTDNNALIANPYMGIRIWGIKIFSTVNAYDKWAKKIYFKSPVQDRSVGRELTIYDSTTYEIVTRGVIQSTTETGFSVTFSSMTGRDPKAGDLIMISTRPDLENVILMQTSWSKLEVTKGVYDFATFEKENHFEWAKKNGKTVTIRIYMDYPNSTISDMEIPTWLYEETNHDGEWYDNDYGKGYSPNYANPIIIANHRKLIEKLAERYANDPSVFIVFPATMGHWAEHHINTKMEMNFPGYEIEKQYIDAYYDNFNGKNNMAVRRNTKASVEKNMGIYNHGFGPYKHIYNWGLNWLNNGYTDNMSGEKEPAQPDFYKYSPLEAEPIADGKFSWDFSSITQMDGDYPRDINKMIKAIKDYHLTMYGASYDAVAQSGAVDAKANMDKFLKVLGYRFIPSKVILKDGVNSFSLNMTISNLGSSRLYKTHQFEICLYKEGNLMMTKLLDSDVAAIDGGMTKNYTYTISTNSNLSAGTYDVYFSIIENGKRLNLPIATTVVSGKYNIGKVVIYK